MNGFDLGSTVYALGWSLVHFLWQGTLIALALELVLLGLRRSSADVRYFVRCGALALMALAPVVTFLLLRPEMAAGTAASGAAPIAGGAPVDEALPSLWGRLTWLTAVVALWATGAAVFATRLLRDYLRIRRLQNSGTGATLPARWQARFDQISAAIGVRAVARVVDSARLTAPMVIGWMKPVVLIPARVLTGLSPEQIEAVLAHELAHIRRHDFLINLIQSALEALLFYHPAVWWVSKGIRAEREYCCDDAALRVTTDEVSYARALTTLESWRGIEPQVGMSTLGGSLMLRIQRMLGIRSTTTRVRGPLAALGALLIASTLGATAFGYAAPQDPEELRALRERIDELQSRLDRLRVQLADATGVAHGDVHDARQNDLHFGDHDGDVHGRHQDVHRDAHDGADLHEPHGNVWLYSDDDGDAQIRVEVRGLEDGIELSELVEKALDDHGSKGHSSSRTKVVVRSDGDPHGLHENVKKTLRSHGIEWEGDGHEVVIEGLDGKGLHEKIMKALEESGVANFAAAHRGKLRDHWSAHGDAVREHTDHLRRFRFDPNDFDFDFDFDVDTEGRGGNVFRFELRGDGDLDLEELRERIGEELHEHDDGRVHVFKLRTSGDGSDVEVDGVRLLERIREARRESEHRTERSEHRSGRIDRDDRRL